MAKEYSPGKGTSGRSGVRILDKDGNPITGEELGSNHAAHVAILDGSGNQITSFGGGTQYTEGDVDATITGTAILGEAPSDTLEPLQLNASNQLQVDIAADSAGLATSANQLPDGHNVTVDNASIDVQGDTAHDAVDAGDPVKIGGHAYAEAGPTAVSTDDRVDAYFDRKGHMGVTIFSHDGTQAADIINVAGFGGLFNIPADLSGHTPDFSSTGETPVWAWSTDNTIANARYALVDSSGHPQIDIIGALPAGTNNIGDVDIASALPAGTNNIGEVDVQGDTADDSADSSGNPVKIGGVARTTNRTAVANGDRVDAAFDDMGRQIVTIGQPRDLTTHARTSIASASETTILSAGGAGVFHDVTMLILTNESNAALEIDIRDSTAGTIRLTINLAPKGGAVIPFPRPLTQATANNNWTADANSTSAYNVFIQAEVNV